MQHRHVQKAAALEYTGEHAPTVTAKGSGPVAKQIIHIAEDHHIYLHEDPLLVEVLSQLELDQAIPPQLYIAVAQIIAFAYLLQGKHPTSHAADS